MQRADHVTKGNTGILIFLGSIVVFRYLQCFAPLSTQLTQGKTVLYEQLLSAIFIVWLLPALTESRRSLTRKNLIHFPLTFVERLLIRLVSVFISPVSWAVVSCSLALLYPLTAASNVIAAAAALLLFLLLAMCVSLLLADLVAAGRVVTLSLAAAAIAAVVLEAPRLAASAAVSPAPVLPLVGMFALAGIALSLCIWSFADSLRLHSQRASRPRMRFTVLRLTGWLGVLVLKDLRLLRRSLDLYLVVPILIVSAIYFAAAPAPALNAPAILLVVLLMPLSSLAFNCFGFETGAGFDRYTLLPLSGRDLLLVKNVSLWIVMSCAFAVILPVVLWRVGITATATALVELALLGFAYPTWGNWMSVARPFQMQPYRLSSGGPIFEAGLGMLFGSLPGVLAILLLGGGRYPAIVLIVALLSLYAFVYRRSLVWAGRRLETQRAAIRRSLS